MTYKTEIRICKRCNKEFKPNQHNQIYCCSKYKLRLSEAVFKCKICGKDFKPNNGNSTICSSAKCKKINKNKIWNKWYRKKLGHKNINGKKECKICGEEFKTNNYRELFCSRECKLEDARKNALKRYYKDKDKILEKRKNNVEWCIMNKLRMRISCAVKSQGTYKAEKTIKLIGCSVKKLKQHLEELFIDDMSWENYGKDGWHIDHIIPCASFDLTVKENQLKCFHYTNLQPLWAQENLIKSSKVLANEN